MWLDFGRGVYHRTNKYAPYMSFGLLQVNTCSHNLGPLVMTSISVTCEHLVEDVRAVKTAPFHNVNEKLWPSQ